MKKVDNCKEKPWTSPIGFELEKPEQVKAVLAKKEPEVSLTEQQGRWYLTCHSDSTFWRQDFIRSFIKGADSV